ncbi:hypothetical protein SNE40_017516 [Patella caerulea]|uniref:P2X purinoreceptor 7 intracellular domain-containing protein n=1 Tax=Patella caerulea TaxID=87958 RepID=A0AAN8PQ37_PATCE
MAATICKCGRCTVKVECTCDDCNGFLCCHTDENPTCVTGKDFFVHECLKASALDQLHAKYETDGLQPGGHPNEQYRYTAYRHYVREVHGILGQGNRVDLPTCVYRAIHAKFPLPY